MLPLPIRERAGEWVKQKKSLSLEGEGRVRVKSLLEKGRLEGLIDNHLRLLLSSINYE